MEVKIKETYLGQFLVIIDHIHIGFCPLQLWRIMVLPALRDLCLCGVVWWCVLGRTEIAISQPCALQSPIGLKLGGDLGLVSQISVHVLFSRFEYFLYCKQTNKQKNLPKTQKL
jgi:hypothetical protein